MHRKVMFGPMLTPVKAVSRRDAIRSKHSQRKAVFKRVHAAMTALSLRL